MEEFVYLNCEKLPGIMANLQAVECKMLLIIMAYLSQTGKTYFVNSEDSRKFMASMGFSKTPERISAILSDMVKKGVLFREAHGVYSLLGDLFLTTNSSKK